MLPAIVFVQIAGTMGWVPIKDYEGLYEINEGGQVKSARRSGSSGKVLKPTVASTGYLCVTLCKNNKKKWETIHRLLAITFFDEHLNGKVINHKDGNKLNNNLENLEVVTASENSLHSHRNRLWKGSKIMPEQRQEIIKRYKGGERQKKIAADYECCQQLISWICREKFV